MANIERFEDIESWKLARELVKRIYQLTKTSLFSKDFGLKDQVQRAAVSIMANIAEGFERGGNKEFIQFLYIAKGSAGEVRSLLYIAGDLEYVPENELTMLHKDLEQVSMKLAGLIRYLQSSELKGAKNKG
jgi:four helix bundle protein